MAPSIGSLVSPDANGNGRDTAIIGGPWESDGSLAMGFFDIADAAVERWKAGHRNDLIVIPIIYNHRHGIELALKDEIREAAAWLREDGATDRDIQADEVDRWVSATHSIGRLVNRLTRLLGRLPLEPDQQLPAETLEVLKKLHVLDHHGEAFRYSAMKTGSGNARVLERVRPGQQHFDIAAVAEALREAGTMVLYGVSGVLDSYAEYQAEMRYYADM